MSCTNPRWETGGTSSDPLSLGMRISHFLETIPGQKSLRVCFLCFLRGGGLPPSVTTRTRSPRQQSSKPISHQVWLQPNHSVPRTGKAGIYGAGKKSQAVPERYGERPSPREAGPTLVQAFQDEGKRWVDSGLGGYRCGPQLTEKAISVANSTYGLNTSHQSTLPHFL